MVSLPPLVSPAAPLTREEFARYSRHVLLPEVGELGQRRLKAAKVLIIGAGGLGAPALQYLAAAGVGLIGVIDDDVVDESNLQRQVIHRTQDIGAKKVDSAVRAVQAINPLISIEPYDFRLTPQKAPALFSQYDLVLDGTDNFPTRYLASDAAAATNVPILWASVLGFNAQISLFWANPPNGGGVTLRDLFPTPPPEGAVPSCSQAGVVGAMVGQVGSAMAAEAVKLILGIGDSLLGRIMVFDQLRTRWSTIPLQGRQSTTTPRVSAPTLRPDSPGITYVDDPLPGAALLDVREDVEAAAGVIPGATHIPLALALTELGWKQLDRATPLVVYCAVSPRAEQAARHLAQHGFTAYVLRGGYNAWSARHQAPHLERRA